MATSRHQPDEQTPVRSPLTPERANFTSRSGIIVVRLVPRVILGRIGWGSLTVNSFSQTRSFNAVHYSLSLFPSSIDNAVTLAPSQAGNPVHRRPFVCPLLLRNPLYPVHEIIIIQWQWRRKPSTKPLFSWKITHAKRSPRPPNPTPPRSFEREAYTLARSSSFFLHLHHAFNVRPLVKGSHGTIICFIHSIHSDPFLKRKPSHPHTLFLLDTREATTSSSQEHESMIENL